MEYTYDINNKEILKKDGINPQVMMEWEIPYMHALIDNVKPVNMDVLEIGYGLGYSAKRIQSYNPKSHTVIECDKVVIDKAKKDNLNINIVKGKWQEMLHGLGKYDFIFFDDHSDIVPSNVIELMFESSRLDSFISLCIDSHLNDNGLISFYWNEESSLVERHSSNNKIKYIEKSIEVDIPNNCKYKKGNKCIIPLICKIA